MTETTADAPAETGGLGDTLKPWAAMGALLVAAGAARVAIHATGHDQAVAWSTAGAAFTVAVVSSWACGRRIVSRRLRSRLHAALYLGAAWVATVAHLGLSWGAVAALTAVGVPLSWAYWSEHPVGLLAEQAPRVGEDVFVQRWEANLGAKGKPLAGSRLLPGPEMIRAGYRYTLELVPGTQTVAAVVAMQAQLRGGLRLTRGQEVIVEEHPTEPAPTALVTVVVRSPIRDSKPWPGPAKAFDSVTGSVNLGPFVDDIGVARWAVYRENGIFGGFMQGDPGSGKSRMFESNAMAVAASETHPTVVWFACGQAGASSPKVLLKHADWAATTIADFHEMLMAAVRIYGIQSKENIAYGYAGFTPTVQRPGLLIFVDELHALLDADAEPILAPACAKLMLDIAREARKAGVAIVAADQSPTLDAFGGSGKGMQTLRSALLNGNGVLLRSENPEAKTVFKVDIRSADFPKLPGYAWLAKPAEGERKAPFRGYFVNDEQIDTVPGSITWRSLSHRQASVAGERYRRRHEIAEERRQAILLELELADAGMTGTLEELGRQMDAAELARSESAKAHVRVDYADGIPSVRPVGRFWLTDAPAARPLTDGEAKILKALARGPAKPGELATATGMTRQGVDAALKRLGEQRGLVRQPQKYGPYELATARAA